MNEMDVLKHLPSELLYLAAPATKFGVHQFDEDIDAFLENATDRDMKELADLAIKVKTNGHYPKVNEWLDRFPIDEHDDAARLYFLFGLLDAADLSFD